MKFVLGLFIAMSVFVSGSISVYARMPETKAEQSLLYWRYLCQDEPQEEKIQNQIRELKCKTQGWRVRAPASSGKIVEIVEE